MTSANLDGMIAVFEDAISALQRPGNDFVWSGWDDEAEALLEVGAVVDELRGGSVPERLKMEILFAPTGPIQEVSVSSGWGTEFLALADRFDRELSRIIPR
jgi:hypothetical protein